MKNIKVDLKNNKVVVSEDIPLFTTAKAEGYVKGAFRIEGDRKGYSSIEYHWFTKEDESEMKFFHRNYLRKKDTALTAGYLELTDEKELTPREAKMIIAKTMEERLNL